MAKSINAQQMIKYLEASGVDIHAGNRLLKVAIADGDYKAVKYLINHGADTSGDLVLAQQVVKIMHPVQQVVKNIKSESHADWVPTIIVLSILLICIGGSIFAKSVGGPYEGLVGLSVCFLILLFVVTPVHSWVPAIITIIILLICIGGCIFVKSVGGCYEGLVGLSLIVMIVLFLVIPVNPEVGW